MNPGFSPQFSASPSLAPRRPGPKRTRSSNKIGVTPPLDPLLPPLLLDDASELKDAEPEDAETPWVDSASGGFLINVLADIFVRIAVLIGNFFMLHFCCRRRRERERIARELENAEASASRPRLESRFAGPSGSPGTPPVSHAAQSSLSTTAPPLVPDNHEQTTGSIPAGSIPGSPPQATASKSAIPTTGSVPGSIPGSPASSTNAVPTEPEKAVQTTKRPCDKLRQRKLNEYTTKSRSMDDATSSSSESPAIATPGPDVVVNHHVMDMPFSRRYPGEATHNIKLQELPPTYHYPPLTETKKS